MGSAIHYVTVSKVLKQKGAKPFVDWLNKELM